MASGIRKTEAQGIGVLLPAITLILLSVLMLGGLSVKTPAAGEQVAVVFPPGTPQVRAMAKLDGLGARVVRGGAFGNVVVAHFDTARSWADLRRVGAWIAIDPLAAGGCLLADETLLANPTAGERL